MFQMSINNRIWRSCIACFCARPTDKSHLGVGALLYLNFLRWLALLFFLQGLASLPSLGFNSSGSLSTTLESTEMDVLEFLAVSTSIVNLASPNWTPGGENFCNGHGFAARACGPDGWSAGTIDGYDYACGAAPPNKTSRRSFSALLLSGGLAVPCNNPITLCYCFPGYSGPHCTLNSTSTSSITPSLTAPGFCKSPSKAAFWWTLPVGSEARALSKKVEATLRVSGTCSGRGACTGRVSTGAPNKLLYAFCVCDLGWYGVACEFSNTQNSTSGIWPVHGSRFGIEHTSRDGLDACEPGVMPDDNWSIGGRFLVFPSYTCAARGFGVVLPLLQGGMLGISNSYRVQTSSICFCEPGFAGEECMGRTPVPDSAGYVTTSCCVLFFGTFFILYRSRKRAEQEFDDANVTPRDFTVFVNYLPPCIWYANESHAGGGPDVTAIRRHFEQFGPVHAVQAAPDDEDLYYLQIRKNVAMLALHVARENAAHSANALRSEAFGNGGSQEVLNTKSATEAVLIAQAVRPTENASEAIALPHLPVWMPRLPPPIIMSSLYTSGSAPRTPAVLSAADTLRFVYHDNNNNISINNNYNNNNSGSSSIEGGELPPLDFATNAILRMGQGDTLSPTILKAHILALDRHIAVAASDPKNGGFRRAFVTFLYSSDMHDCLDIYRNTARSVAADAHHHCVRKCAERAKISSSTSSINHTVATSVAAAATSVAHNDTTTLNDYTQSRTGLKSRVHLGFGVTRKVVTLRQAPEPDEVLWDSLDTNDGELWRRSSVTFIYSLFVASGIFQFIINLSADKASGWGGFGIALAIVIINMLVGQHWALAAEMEQHYTVGSRMRSIFFKTLATQVVTTIIGGTLGVYGIPADYQNGFIADWYEKAGGFVLRTVIIEALLPPTMNFLSPVYRIKCVKSWRATSFTAWASARVPPSYRLELRCAALMRTVLLVCSFNAGLPILNFALSICLCLRWAADAYSLDHIFRLQRTGAELPRALEMALALAGLLQAATAWVYFGSGSTGEQYRSPVTMWTFFLLAGFLLWTLLGYFSFKYARGRDCCCGLTALLPIPSLSAFDPRNWPYFSSSSLSRARAPMPMTAPPPASNINTSHRNLSQSPPLPPPHTSILEAVHVAFMRLLFGEFFFGDYEDQDDETEGKPYIDLVHELHAAGTGTDKGAGAIDDAAAAAAETTTRRLTFTSVALMRAWPYRLPERAQVFPQQDSGEPDPPLWTANKMFEWQAARTRLRKHSVIEQEKEREETQGQQEVGLGLGLGERTVTTWLECNDETDIWFYNPITKESRWETPNTEADENNNVTNIIIPHHRHR
jgi:hypothetical protein